MYRANVTKFDATPNKPAVRLASNWNTTGRATSPININSEVPSACTFCHKRLEANRQSRNTSSISKLQSRLLWQSCNVLADCKVWIYFKTFNFILFSTLSQVEFIRSTVRCRRKLFKCYCILTTCCFSILLQVLAMSRFLSHNNSPTNIVDLAWSFFICVVNTVFNQLNLTANADNLIASYN